MLNPKAGQGRALAKATHYLAGQEHVDLDLVVPDPRNYESQLRSAREVIDQGVDAVIMHGGDGVVNTGFNLVAHRDIPLGIVPSGTGNDFARAAGINIKDPVEALRSILHNLERPQPQVRQVDALTMSLTTGQEQISTWVANSINIGFDARTNQVANQLSVPGSLRYVTALLKVVPEFEVSTFSLKLDGGLRHDMETALICIQNGRYIGGGIPLVTDARQDDGYAAFSTVESSSKSALLALFPLLYARAHRAITPLTTTKIRYAQIGIPPGVPVYADGDEVLAGSEYPTMLEVAADPGAVKVLVSGARPDRGR